MKPYLHTVHYYETDKMAITHHSNYVRWMEEARVDFLQNIGWNFDRMEAEGISSPVLSVSCRYLHSTTFADVIEISVCVKEICGVRMFLEYKMRNAATAEEVCSCTSEHCFFGKSGRPLRLEKDCPDFYKALMEG